MVPVEFLELHGIILLSQRGNDFPTREIYRKNLILPSVTDEDPGLACLYRGLYEAR